MQPFVRLGRIGGIEIGIHYTWLLIAALIAGSFVGFFSSAHPRWPSRGIWSPAILISGLFLVSVMLHQTAHAVVARVYGMPVRTITRFALGGVTRIQKQAGRPAGEFWMGRAGSKAAASSVCDYTTHVKSRLSEPTM